MTSGTIAAPAQIDIAAVMGGLYGDGIIGTKGAFDRDWVRDLGEDIEVLFQDALKRPGGAVGRGPKRYYVEIHPEGIRGFLDLATHPWVVAVCESVLSPDYKMGEISARSALTIHRGTPNRSSKSRPVLVLGVDAPDARNADRHDLQFTRDYYEGLPEDLRRHL